MAVFHGPGGWGATMRRGGCWTGPERPHEPFRRPPRLALLASSGGGTPKRTIHVLQKPDILFAPDRIPGTVVAIPLPCSRSQARLVAGNQRRCLVLELTGKRKLTTVVVYTAIGLAAVIIFLQAMNHTLLRESYDELRDSFSSAYPGYLVPTFTNTTVDGDSITVGEHHDGRQLLFVFSPNGEYSGASAPVWRAFANSVAKEHPDVQVIGIDRDGEGGAADFRDDHGFDFPVTTFPTPKLAMLYRVRGTPVVISLDQRGRVLYSRTGVFTDPVAIDSVAVAIRELVGRDGPAAISDNAEGVEGVLGGVERDQDLELLLQNK